MLRALHNCTKFQRGQGWTGSLITIICRYRSGGAVKTQRPRPQQEFDSRRPSVNRHTFSKQYVHIPHILESEVIPYFEDNVHKWATSPSVRRRLISYGIPELDVRKLLNGFVEEVEAGLLSDKRSQTYYSLSRFSHQHDRESIDILYSTIFFSWAGRADNREELVEALEVNPDTVQYLGRLLKVTSRPYMADEFDRARMVSRKIIMHVGPTNSGKTHHALRALAAARTGVYAGPLRLLAHEIWERLNTGQIVPLGVEEAIPDVKAKTRGNPAHARVCNMITGEEQKLVSPEAPLLSCTVEMLQFFTKYDVAVIDEIQMIGDAGRGNAWTSAVLGIPADEVHLCGEETAIPIVQALLKHTGDEIIIKRYERLTPLVVEKTSLDADFSKVRPGDAIVTFSRSNIFEIKSAVEKKTGMRCAVVYGRLPPEVRSEQAALFNDPDSGYDVIIGSDAIGMGLNLKIKRVIFEAVSKYEDGGVRPLSTSSVKQIAGRAGRYGQHKDQVDLGGTTTTLYPGDLEALKGYLQKPYEPLPYGRVGLTAELIEEVLAVLPAGTPLAVALTAVIHVGRIPPFLRYVNYPELEKVCDFVDAEWLHMGNADKASLLWAPLPWRDVTTMSIVKKMLAMHARQFEVDLASVIKGTDFMQTLEYVEDMKEKVEQGTATFSTSSTLLKNLESFHKALVFYMWMNFRNPVVYSDYSVIDLKKRVEILLNWSLASMSISDELLVREIRPLSPDADALESISLDEPPAPHLAARTRLHFRKERSERELPADLLPRRRQYAVSKSASL
ncbi:hypothetical protein D9613_003474 [Agrocybe pediades]|uniref:RNA helicase n=1 Tax=Agrocybe pediades TaxID=84607 RepID=A0A8H4QPQ9_9AGAR|nr:hypothetical protein D9613_003474 [Agrocybe pediades]